MNAANEPARQNSYSGFLILSLVLAVIFIIVVLMPLEPSDYWTYLRIGQEIIRIHALPSTEFMTFTSGGHPAVFSYWLPSLALLGIYKLGGLTLTALIMGVCVVLCYVFFWLCLRNLKLGSISSGLVLLLVALMGSNNWSTRPQNFVLPLFGASLYLLVRWFRGQDRELWLFPLISVLWVNLHGSFILLFVLLFSALIFGGGDRKKLLWITLASAAATLMNPYGFGLWKNTLGMIGNPMINKYSYEWQPPANNGWQLNLFFATLLIIALAAAFSKVRLKPIWWVWFLGFGWMALSSIRYVIWFSMVSVLLLAQLALPWLDRFVDRKPVLQQKLFNLILGVLILVFPLSCLPGIRQLWWTQAPANVTDTTPVKAVEWMKSQPNLPEQVWANWAASIYMSYALPEHKVWITNRIEDFDEQIFVDNRKLMSGSYDWQAILDKYGVKTLLLDRANNKPLIKAVNSSNDWKQVYQDDLMSIYER